MRDDGRILRAELARIGTRRGRCIPPTLKARAAAWIAARRAEGHAVSELATELGIAMGTALRWSNELGRTLVPVEVVADASPCTVAVVSPRGFRIEGLSMLDAVRALRELG